MKALQRLFGFSILLAGLVLLFPGCYTQLAMSERETRSEYDEQKGEDQYAYDESDTLASEQRYDDEWYPYYRYRFGFRYYDPWFYGYYNPWYWSPYSYYPYDYYGGFYGYYPYYGYFDPYRFYGGYPFVVYSSSGRSATRQSGYRRSGFMRGEYGYGTTAGRAGFNIAPASRTSGARNAGTTRSGSYAPANRSNDASSGRSMWRGRPTTNAKPSGGVSRGSGTTAPSGRSSAPATRQSGGGTPSRGSRGNDNYNNTVGSSRGSEAPSRGSAPSYTPPPSPPSTPPASTGGASSGGNRSSGASRTGRDR